MRTADINRAKRAFEHLKAAKTLLDNIKMKNVNMHELAFIVETKERIDESGKSLRSLIVIQNTENDTHQERLQ